jgi:hypothetical protein
VATFKVCRDIGQSFSNSLYGTFHIFQVECVGKLDQSGPYVIYRTILRQCMYLRCHSGHWHVCGLIASLLTVRLKLELSPPVNNCKSCKLSFKVSKIMLNNQKL